MKIKFPQVRFENEIDYVEGDITLVRVLMSNLMDNAVREDPCTKFAAKGNTIEIFNWTDRLDEKDVRNMNMGKKPIGEKILGNGFGLEFCAEIVRQHGWELSYEIINNGLLTRLRLKK